ncbi:hypothetical protein ACFVYV_25170 [Streptomyces mirabilis]|uniref:hypothetical protein n=1 Tax=Streptomyces mirabilis TaxID=68239 RepID=UPI0036DD54E3
MKTHRPQSEQYSRLVVALGAGLLVFALVVLFAALVDDDDSDSSSHRCPGYAVGTVDPYTCLPYSHSHAHGHGGGTTANRPGSSARRPAQPWRPKAAAAKVPAAPKAPAPKAPAAPPRLSLRK